MKILKYILTLVFIINFIFLIDVADAATGEINAGDISLECVYDNGYILKFSYVPDAGVYGISSSTIKLVNSFSLPYNTSLTYFYDEANFAKKYLNSGLNVGKCPSKLGYTVIQQYDKDNNSSTFQVFYDGTNKAKEDALYKDSNLLKSKSIVAGFSPVDGNFMKFEIDENSRLASKTNGWSFPDGSRNTAGFIFSLVSERVHFENEIEPAYTWAFKSSGGQAASKTMYVKIYKYKSNGYTTYFLEKDGEVTSLGGHTASLDSIKETDKNNPQTICFKPAVKSIETAVSDTAYTFSDVNHSVQYKFYQANPNCKEGYTPYFEVDVSEVPDEGVTGTSICDIIPETSLILAEIINYARIFVPAALIILTAIDISRIVISGNIEEDLPKRKKVIIIRFIVALVFFFLPVFVQVIISSNYGVDFGDVSCLWN